jgi:hypothetical protein
MKLKNESRCFSVTFYSKGQNTDTRSTVQLVVSIRGIYMEFYVTEELATLIPMEGTTTRTNLCEEMKKALYSSDISIQKLTAVMTGGEPSMVGRNSGVSSVITNDVKRTSKGTNIRQCKDLLSNMEPKYGRSLAGCLSACLTRSGKLNHFWN